MGVIIAIRLLTWGLWAIVGHADFGRVMHTTSGDVTVLPFQPAAGRMTLT
jgi:hypothetical protein